MRVQRSAILKPLAKPDEVAQPDEVAKLDQGTDARTHHAARAAHPPTHPHNLPTPRDRFIGREALLAQCTRLHTTPAAHWPTTP